MTRRVVAVLAALLLGGLVSLDMSGAGAPDIYAAPPIIALGSGQAAGDAHCAALPR